MKTARWAFIRNYLSVRATNAISQIRSHRERDFDRPAPVESLGERLVADANFFSPLANVESFTVESYVPSVPASSYLLRECGPSAIFRLICAIVVDAVNGMFLCWAPAHVANKGRVTCTPSLANRYPATAVIFPVWLLGVVTAAFHAAPHSIFWFISNKRRHAKHFTATCANRLSEKAIYAYFDIAFHVLLIGSLWRRR